MNLLLLKRQKKHTWYVLEKRFLAGFIRPASGLIFIGTNLVLRIQVILEIVRYVAQHCWLGSSALLRHSNLLKYREYSQHHVAEELNDQECHCANKKSQSKGQLIHF